MFLIVLCGHSLLFVFVFLSENSCLSFWRHEKSIALQQFLLFLYLALCFCHPVSYSQISQHRVALCPTSWSTLAAAQAPFTPFVVRETDVCRGQHRPWAGQTTF